MSAERGRWYSSRSPGPWTEGQRLRKEGRTLVRATETDAPWQTRRVPSALPRVIAELAFDEYMNHHGHRSQTFERLHERGGFSVSEVVSLLADRCERLAEDPS